MIETTMHPAPYWTGFTNGEHSAFADAPQHKGGGAAALGPHELLEAALATCISMAVRMRAAHEGIALEDVRTRVHLDRTHEGTATFECDVQIIGVFSPEQRQLLMDSASNCPVRQTLSKQLEFRLRSTREHG